MAPSSVLINHTTIKYGKHDRQVIGIWRQSPPPPTTGRWIVFIHGGAWRDPNNTYKDGEFLLNELLTNHHSASQSIAGTASIDYRLSPAVKHPAHVDDVISALQHLGIEFSVSEFVLVGHSAGAFLSLQVLTRWNDVNNTATIPLIVPAEGIYNLPYMLEEHPSYEGFVREAFGDNKTDWEKASPIGSNFHWEGKSSEVCNDDDSVSVVYPGVIVIVHSPEDELLGIDYQPKFAKAHLQKSVGHEIDVFEELAHGKHDDVYRDYDLVNIVQKYIDKI